MKGTLKVFNSFEEEASAEMRLWAQKTPEMRLRHLERLRRLNFPGYDGNTANISRVCKVSQLQGR